MTDHGFQSDRRRALQVAEAMMAGRIHGAANGTASAILGLAEIVPFTLPRPRVPETTADPEFVRVKAHTLDVFRREMKA